jgi:hypothetical protein
VQWASRTVRWEVQIAISTYRQREITPEQERGAGSNTGDIATGARRQLRGGKAVGRIKSHPMEGRSPWVGQGAMRIDLPYA